MCQKSMEHIGTKWSCDTEAFLEASPACTWRGCFGTTHNQPELMKEAAVHAIRIVKLI